METKEELRTILKRVAEGKNFTNFEVITYDEVLRGEGFLSEIYKGDVKNTDTGELTQTYIKVPSPCSNDKEYKAYHNEYIFYSNIYPELDKFQKDKGVKILFDKIPKFYCGSVAADSVYIVLENLEVQKYTLYDKTKFLDENHLKTIFEVYGKYHALTFAFKDQNHDKYHALVKPLNDQFANLQKMDHAQVNAKGVLQVAYDTLKKIDEESAAKVKPLLDDIKGTCRRGMFYEGEYASLTHGDCWSNNMLFKYNANGALENLKLLDHQAVRDSTPIHDLSYLFYSGASKKDFDKLEEYLELYHKSFSSYVKELGSDPDKLLPLDALKSDWKKYSFLGVFMGLLLWPTKLMSKKNIEEVVLQEGEEAVNKYSEKCQVIYQSEILKNNICNLLLHAIEYNII